MGDNGQEDSGFKKVIVVEADSKGSWKVDFKISPMAVVYLLEQIKFNMLSGRFETKKEPMIVTPSQGDIHKVESEEIP